MDIDKQCSLIACFSRQLLELVSQHHCLTPRGKKPIKNKKLIEQLMQ